MATHTNNLTLSSGGVLTGEHSLTDANAQRIIAAHRTRYNMAPASTAQQVWARIDEDIWDVLKTRTLNAERDAEIAAITDDPLT